MVQSSERDGKRAVHQLMIGVQTDLNEDFEDMERFGGEMKALSSEVRLSLVGRATTS